MGATFIGTPESVQRSTATSTNKSVSVPPPVPPWQLDDHATRADIAELAYLLWEQNGYPTGSAESDWLEAERRIQERINFAAIPP